MSSAVVTESLIDASNEPAVYDIVVVGAGPAGLAAAWRAAMEGLRVAVVDDNPSAGGQIWRGEREKPSSPEAQVWFERIASAQIRFIPGARIFRIVVRKLTAVRVVPTPDICTAMR